MTKMRIESSVSENFPIEDYLKQIDILVRHTALPKAITAASKVVVNDAKKRIPRSSVTGTAKKKSKSQREADKRRRPLADSIGTKIIKKKDGQVVIGVTGQKLLPEQIGKDRKSVVAHSHLLEFGHRGVFWRRTNWSFETKLEDGGFKYRQRADGTRRSDERIQRRVKSATLVGGQTRRDFVEAKRWLAPAVDSTQAQQYQAMVSTLSQMIASQR